MQLGGALSLQAKGAPLRRSLRRSSGAPSAVSVFSTHTFAPINVSHCAFFQKAPPPTSAASINSNGTGKVRILLVYLLMWGMTGAGALVSMSHSSYVRQTTSVAAAPSSAASSSSIGSELSDGGDENSDGEEEALDHGPGAHAAAGSGHGCHPGFEGLCATANTSSIPESVQEAGGLPEIARALTAAGLRPSSYDEPRTPSSTVFSALAGMRDSKGCAIPHVVLGRAVTALVGSSKSQRSKVGAKKVTKVYALTPI